MKTKSMSMTAAGLALAGLMLAGCVPSLNPLYTDEDLVFEPKLVGVWAENAEAKERWTFEQAGEKAYRVIYEEDGERGEFEVRLLRLGDQLYLDFFPNDEAMKSMERNDLYKYHWLPAHTFARVYQVEPELSMAFMNPDWLAKRLKAEPDAIAHVMRGDDAVVLTASTKALQAFVRKHADEAFGEGKPSDAADSKLRRIK
ncbi:MAG: hypothetical protein KJ072_07370 [Verrucomicrobia bacterium]|nr:hypothetical protein [Verrucomicrobiota bacterium]